MVPIRLKMLWAAFANFIMSVMLSAIILYLIGEAYSLAYHSRVFPARVTEYKYEYVRGYGPTANPHYEHRHTLLVDGKMHSFTHSRAIPIGTEFYVRLSDNEWFLEAYDSSKKGFLDYLGYGWIGLLICIPLWVLTGYGVVSRTIRGVALGKDVEEEEEQHRMLRQARRNHNDAINRPRSTLHNQQSSSNVRNEETRREADLRQAERRRLEEERLKAESARRATQEQQEKERCRAEETRRRADEQRGRENEKQANQQNRNRQNAAEPVCKDEHHYASKLGLHGQMTFSDIKQCYRELASQYHPDKVSHLGPLLREVAATEMKELNEAYEYFKKKFGA